MNYANRFRVKTGSRVNLADLDADFHGEFEDESSAEIELRKYFRRLGELQSLMNAENKHSLLVVLQAMDAGGKDGTIRHVMEAWNPQGCRVESFKVPTAEELAHDFLWRIHKVTPRKGQITVFNRSHYEDVLVVRVHNLVKKEVWSKRYNDINNFERQLSNSGTTIVKFFLHIDKDEQLERFGNRLDEPEKQWKISDSDYSEREFWDDYQQAYMDVLSKCSFNYAPWYVIPSNRKWFRNLAVSQILVETMEAWKMEYPEPLVDLNDIKLKYHAEMAEAQGIKVGESIPQALLKAKKDKKDRKKGKKKNKKDRK